MRKQIVPIFMLYFALAIMLGHNFIVHNHYDFQHNKETQNHHDGHHHGHDHGSEEEKDDWGHVFLSFHHSVDGLTFFNSISSVDQVSNRFSDITPIHSTHFIFSLEIFDIRQNAPPDIASYYNSQNLPPSGLRAPPTFII